MQFRCRKHLMKSSSNQGNSKLADSISQGYEVVSHDAVLVGVEDFVSQLPSLQFLAQPQQIMRQLNFCRQVPFVVDERPALINAAFLKAILL